jgi:Domain of unknown function (DUF4405)
MNILDPILNFLEDRDVKINNFKFKVFTSFILTFSFFIASFSGIILYFTPKGRVANWIHWTLMGLDKDQWGSIHIIFVTMMLVAGLFHLFWFNWKVFWCYIKTRSSKSIRRPLELGISVILCVLFWLGTVYEVQPAHSLKMLSDVIKESYETAQHEPPIPHAEDLTIQEVADKLAKIPTDELIRKLTSVGYPPSGKSQILGDLAYQFDVSPQTVLNAVEIEKVPEKQYHTSGQGKMTVAEYCKLKKINLDLALIGLKEAGFADVSRGKTIKEYSAENGLPPNEIVRILHEDQNIE